MKFAILLLAIFVVSIATVVYVYAESNPLGQILPKDEPNFKPTITQGTFNGKDVEIIKDEPNFKPTITQGTFNGKDVEIIEFKSKLGK